VSGVADHQDWEFISAVNFGRSRPVEVTSGVDHYTGGGSGRAVARYVAGKTVYKGKLVPAPDACGHLIVCRDGAVIQQVPFADRAYHAGTRSGRGDLWKGAEPKRNVNDFTVGLENSNYGWLIKHQGAFFVPRKKNGIWVPGTRYPSKLPEPIRGPDHRGELKYWEPYSEELVESNIRIKKVLIDLGLVGERENWVGHSDVSPNRKSDPGPLFPIEYILDEAFGSDVAIEGFVINGVSDPSEEESDMGDFIERADQDLVGHYDDDAGMCLI